MRLFVFRINLDGICSGAVRAMWQGQILNVPFFAVQLLDGVVLEVAAAMERERLHGVSGPWTTAFSSVDLPSASEVWQCA